MKTNTHFRNTILFVFITFTFGNCKNNNLEEEIFNNTYNKFHGRYKLTKSTASEPVDMNFDEKKSYDLLSEIPSLSNTYLQLNVYKGGNIFTQFWQEPYFKKSYDNFPVDFNPENIVMDYNLQAESHFFEFTSDLKKIKVIRNKNSGSTDYKWTLPESVNVVSDELIEIITNRKMYTSDGVKMIKITSLYKRYQKFT